MGFKGRLFSTYRSGSALGFGPRYIIYALLISLFTIMNDWDTTSNLRSKTWQTVFPFGMDGRMGLYT